jgi:hypothetical protein
MQVKLVVQISELFKLIYAPFVPEKFFLKVDNDAHFSRAVFQRFWVVFVARRDPRVR